ncbi:MAG: hypothetical protein HYS51_02100 [Candidatus Zambryskibacteria bacterium]|nr:hypothetical protein [Candidatus Zambryskibacteria bacterium]
MALKKRKKIFIRVILLIVIVVIVLVGYISLLTKRTTGPAHTNSIDETLSLNSHKVITDKAKMTEARFKDLAFAKSKNPLLFSSQTAAVVRTVKSLAKSLKHKPVSKEYSTWIWTPVLLMTNDYIQNILSGAKVNGINTIYLSIDSYLDIFSMKEGPEKDREKEKFDKKVFQFIQEADKNGISVDAEGGWRNWAESGNEYKALAVLDYVKEFNSTHSLKFSGFQYDVEPYLLLKYKIMPTAVLRNFVALVDKTENFLSPKKLRFSVVVPDFWDEIDKVVPIFEYQNKEGSVIIHLLDILDKNDENALIVMAYRNFAKGTDGSIEISNNEMETARSGLYNTKVIIAQETGDFPPPYITFHGMSKDYFNEQLTMIDQALGNNPNFGGFAIHYVNTLLELK